VVDAVKFKMLRSTYTVEAFFERPILDWSGVMPRFFGMIFKSVGTKIPVKASEFSAVAANNLGEVQGRYNIYGGESSFSLYADRLSANFPVLIPSDYELAGDLLKAVHDAFRSEFPDCSFGRTETSVLDHAEILPPHTVHGFLSKYRLASLDEAFGTGAIVEPSVKFKLKGTDQAWELDAVVEQSVFHAAALFLAYNIKLRDVTKLPTYEEKSAFAAQISDLALSALGLEQVP
jgi:hypothetical protein